jgi:hypothetical protein
LSDPEIQRGQDIPTLAVTVLDQGDERGPVGVVLDRFHNTRDINLVPLKIDDPVHALVPAAPVPGGEMAAAIPAPGNRKIIQEGFIGNAGCQVIIGQSSPMA